MQRTDSLEKTDDSMDVSLSELRELVMDREAWRAAIHGVAKSQTWLSNWTELNWTEWSSSFLYFLGPEHYIVSGLDSHRLLNLSIFSLQTIVLTYYETF